MKRWTRKLVKSDAVKSNHFCCAIRPILNFREYFVVTNPDAEFLLNRLDRAVELFFLRINCNLFVHIINTL